MAYLTGKGVNREEIAHHKHYTILEVTVEQTKIKERIWQCNECKDTWPFPITDFCKGCGNRIAPRFGHMDEYCPNCGNKVGKKAKMCGKCGEKLLKECPKCGGFTPAGKDRDYAKFCSHCGKDFS
ncbi:zinc ribbon domain-containing protein [Candidatus Undinarchaeota archaeon]